MKLKGVEKVAGWEYLTRYDVKYETPSGGENISYAVFCLKKKTAYPLPDAGRCLGWCPTAGRHNCR